MRIRAGIGRFKIDSNCFRVSSASSAGYANTKTSAYITERTKCRYLYEIRMALLNLPVRRTIPPRCEDKYILFSSEESLYATTRNVSRSSIGMHIDPL